MKKSIEITNPRYPAARESQGKLTGTLTEGERRKVVWERACQKVVHALHGMSDMKKDLNFSNEPSHSRIKLVIVTLAIHRMHCIISVYNNTRRHFILFLYSEKSFTMQLDRDSKEILCNLRHLLWYWNHRKKIRNNRSHC